MYTIIQLYIYLSMHKYSKKTVCRGRPFGHIFLGNLWYYFLIKILILIRK